MSLASLFAAAVLMMSPTADRPADLPRVSVEQGVLVGRAADGVASFKGVPYALPPVGDLRWRAPQHAEPWNGERDAGQVGAICIQPPANGDNGVGPLPMSEDCLTLNVWAPEGAEGPLPVMVWIHGGGLVNGSGTAALYDGTNLAKRGVVVVTINYRLGRLGFFAHPALAAERGPGEPAGDYGLMDVVAALRWVRNNAEAFGGDPGNVTIFGESAGGALVTRLMIAPEANGLFHRAVVQSGLGRDEGTPLSGPRRDGGPSMQARGETFAAGLGLEVATPEQLRGISAEAFLKPAPNFYGGDLLVRDGATAPSRLRFDKVQYEGFEDEPQFRPMPVESPRVMSAYVGVDFFGGPAVYVQLDASGARALETLTAATVGGQLEISLDGELLAAPTVVAPLANGSFMIDARGERHADGSLRSGPLSQEQAASIVEQLAAPRQPALISEDVEAAFAAGREAPVPLIIGTNSAEFWWMRPSDLSPYGAIDDAMTPEERAAFLAAYGGQDGYDAHVLSDLVFNEPARHLARLHARNGHPTYLYRFDVVSAAMPEPHAGATHASERQYVFDTLTASPWPTAEMDQRAADAMAGYWTSFALKGDPNAAGAPVWPEFGAERDRLLEFTNDGPTAKTVPFADRLDLVEAYYGRVRP